MISPEQLRFFPFFGGLNDSQLRAIAMIAQEKTFQLGETIFHQNQAAESLYFLVEGSVDLFYHVQKSQAESDEEKILVGEIDPGEPFSISSLIEPYLLTASAFVAKPSRVIKIQADSLRDLFKTDSRMAYLMTYEVAKALMNRLDSTRILLAAA